MKRTSNTVCSGLVVALVEIIKDALETSSLETNGREGRFRRLKPTASARPSWISTILPLKK